MGQTVFTTFLSIIKLITAINSFRIKYIKQKKAKHIAIHENDGTIEYSQDLPLTNRINGCLKIHLEQWLRGNFLFDYTKRSYSIFNDLRRILSIKIVTIYSVYTSKYHHYEYEDSTLISTLQSWIALDTKISIPDQLLLTERNYTSKFPDNALIIDYIPSVNTKFTKYFYKYFIFLFVFQHGEIVFIVYKKKELINTHIEIPNIVKSFLIQKTFKLNWNKAKKFYVNSAHFIYALNNETNGLKLSYYYLTKYVKFAFWEETDLFSLLRNNLMQLVNFCECLKNVESRFDYEKFQSKLTLLNALRAQEECLNYTKDLMKHCEKCCKKHNGIVSEWKRFQEYDETLTKAFNERTPYDM